MCDIETSRIGAPYIYDISSVRVKEKIVHNNLHLTYYFMYRNSVYEIGSPGYQAVI